MEFSADPYEYKLYQMFQSCDSNQCGYLDENSLRRLCAQLELRDKGSVLIENLAKEGRTSHVTFENFKEALLNFLGTEIEGASTTGCGMGTKKEKQIIENEEIGNNCGGKYSFNYNYHTKQIRLYLVIGRISLPFCFKNYVKMKEIDTIQIRSDNSILTKSEEASARSYLYKLLHEKHSQKFL